MHTNKVLAQMPPDLELPKFPTIPAHVLHSYVPAKIFDDHTLPITSIHLSDSGQHLVATSQDDTVDIYDCNMGTVHTIQSRKYGAHLGRFTHNARVVLHVSTKEAHPNAHAIRQLDLQDNKYLSYFNGHKAPVTGLEMSPIEDLFVSTSLDGTIKLWATNDSSPQNSLKLETGHRAVVNFDPTGKVLAVATYVQGPKPEYPLIRLYDVRQLGAGPFAAQPIQDPHVRVAASPLTHLKFSNDGLYVLVSTAQDLHYVLDAYQPDVTVLRAGHARGPHASLADFSPDSRCILTPDLAGSLTVAPIATPAATTGNTVGGWNPVAVLDAGLATAPMHMALANHRYEMLVSVSSEILCFWLPDDDAVSRKEPKK